MGVAVTESEEPPQVEGMRVSYQRVGFVSNTYHGERYFALREQGCENRVSYYFPDFE